MKTFKKSMALAFSMLMGVMAGSLWVAAMNDGMEPYMVFVCFAVSLVAVGLSAVAFMLTDL